MTKDDCYLLGHITKTHGVNGELVFFLDVDDPNVYEELESVLIEVKGDLLPYFIESIAIVKGSRAIVAIEGIDTIEQASRLIKANLYLPLDNLEPIEDNTRFYFHEIVDFRIIDSNEGELGTVTTVYNMDTQDLIEMSYQGKEVLIPINSDIVHTVDRTNKTLNVTLPDGLLDVYLSDAPDHTDAPDGDEAYDED
ncbi:ribosome maturation factor RimM [Arsenicibacter rosenii]|uniref:Ribosome maturation factor RimM n=1 Tax=Arsenicibacter rosenii TaxID=1750698 RepID=A0A1S2VMD3_9BACT|nr:ribosome maturation factor RimM [Arsenicibacter rosenii]OIN59931.1 16S rRNA processing protein RimM [Arsenicibacter rosenii]